MVKVQINLDDKEDQIVEVFKAKKRIDTKEKAIKKIIYLFSDCKHEFKIIKEAPFKSYDPTSYGRGSYIKYVQHCKNCGEFKEYIIQVPIM